MNGLLSLPLFTDIYYYLLFFTIFYYYLQLFSVTIQCTMAKESKMRIKKSRPPMGNQTEELPLQLVDDIVDRKYLILLDFFWMHHQT